MELAVKIRNLCKTYDDGFEALKGIDIDIKKGDFFALLGRNGAGKSTMIGIISTLVNKTSGLIEIFGHDIDTQQIQLKRSIGIVPQEFNFDQFEKVENIIMTQAGYYGIPKKIARERCEYYLKQLDLWDKRDTISRWLSGGMKRRLMVARAMMNDPQLLILDEPTAGVDVELRHSLWQFLQDVNKKGTTVILTTHYLEEAEHLCRTLGIIDAGKILELTSMKQLLSQLTESVFILDLHDPLEKLPEIEGFKNVSLIDNKTLEIVVDDSRNVNELFQALTACNIRVRSFRNQLNRLERLFLKVTSKPDQKNS